MLIIFLITFIGLMGFGIVLPLFPFYAERLGASPEIITLTMSVFSLGQFFAAPFWGRISDSIGRKKVLNFCRNLFEKNEIKIKVIKIYTLKNRYTTSCQIEIKLNKKIYLRVVDIIHFNKNYKIKKIEAYKG